MGIINLNHSKIVPRASFCSLLWSSLNICPVSPHSLHGRHGPEKRSNAQLLFIQGLLWSYSIQLPRKVEIWKSICSFLDLFLGHPLCQKPPRLLSGTTSVLLDSMMMLWRHLEDGALPRRVEIWKLICSFLDVSVGHPLCKIHLLRNHQHPHKLLDDALEGESERSENVKKGKKWKTWKREKELHSQAHSVTLIQNVHNFTQLDTSGYKWTPRETWPIIDSSGHWWTKIYTSKDEWTQLDTTSQKT